ncbi:MAG: hypothetical protein ACLUI3_07140 [Christensenellales bacterium]
MDGVRVLNERCDDAAGQSVETTASRAMRRTAFTIRRIRCSKGGVCTPSGADGDRLQSVRQAVARPCCVMTSGCKTTREDGIMRITEGSAARLRRGICRKQAN